MAQDRVMTPFNAISNLVSYISQYCLTPTKKFSYGTYESQISQLQEKKHCGENTQKQNSDSHLLFFSLASRTAKLSVSIRSHQTNPSSLRL